MWPLPQYDSSIRPSQVGSLLNAKLASSDLKSELVARHKSNLLVTLSVVPPKHEKDHKCISKASRRIINVFPKHRDMKHIVQPRKILRQGKSVSYWGYALHNLIRSNIART
ncbi:hypothetical protein L3X38_037826 [Prunus dulcis]|uniref:Uncharacterized protein n=1 Tax=Prunus dulcis TaxID=3755 RepID=A0AAD4V591_PRUDU|nr:hypothetical protein L3X38_037826 [Prunus dulcis]